MAIGYRYFSRLPRNSDLVSRIIRTGSLRDTQKRDFHDYWTHKSPSGLSLRVPILKARHHLGAQSSRGDRAENEDRLKVGVMNKLSEIEEHQPFYFAIIDGFPHLKI
jgi:hypothetical protein